MRQGHGDIQIFKLGFYVALLVSFAACSEMKPVEGLTLNLSSTISCSSAANIQKATIDGPEYASKLRLNLSYLENNSASFASKNKASLNVLKQTANVMSVTEKTQVVENIVVPSQTELVATIDKECVENSQEDSLSSDLARHSKISVDELRFESIAFETTDDLSISELQAAIDSDPCVEVVSEQQYVQKAGEVIAAAPGDPDPLLNQQPHLSAIGFNTAMNTFIGGDLISAFVVIAIVDTGVDYNHQDLSFQMWTDINGNYGKDFHNDDDDPMDDSGHGTHVAGLAAASYKNGIGGSGVMGRWSKIMAVKTLGADGSGSIQNVANGVRYAVQNGADIINMSLGAPAQNALLESAVKDAVKANSLVISAAGNFGVALNNENFFSPAGYAKDVAGLVSVGSYDTDTKTLSSFSNFGASTVEIAGPGSKQSQREPFDGLLSTFPSALVTGSPYIELSGTSMASPVVAGSMGLLIGALKSNGISYTAAELEAALMASASVSSSFQGTIKGGRLLNAANLSKVATNAIASGTLCGQ